MRRDEQQLLANGGFTLLELMIVVTLIAIIAGVAVPNYVYSRATANESAVVATLRSMASAQFEFKVLGYMDRNFNGGGEFGTLGELAGTADLRGYVGERMAPPLLSQGLGQVDAAGRLQTHGYHIAVYLPDAAGVGQPGTPAATATVDAQMSESYWTALAWPIDYGSTGRTSFFVNQSGEILESAEAKYDGTTSIPPAGAALLGIPPTRINTEELAVRVAGADGFVWKPVN